MVAAVVPILIHLLNRRRLERIEFSDLRFVAPLNQRRMRSLSLRRLLLLVLRVLIVLLTALALARPTVRGTFSRALPTEARSSVLLLVDTSYSMHAEGEGGTALDAAKSMALRVVDVLERGDQVNVVTFDDAAHPLFQSAVHDLALVRERIGSLEAGHGGTDWTKAVQAALQLLAGASEPNRELYVLSDFRGADLDSVRADLAAEQRDARIHWVPVSVEPFINVSLEDVSIPPGAVLVDEPVRLGVAARNHASDVPAECALQLELGGEPKGQANLRLGGGARQTHEFTVVATRADATAGVVRKRVDRLPEDDVRYFVLPVLPRLQILLVRGAGGASAGAADAGGSFFVSRALAPRQAGRALLQLQEVEAARFASRDLEGVQVAVLASDALLGEGQAQVLADFVREGGGLLVLGGQRTTADAMNRRLFERLGSARVRGIVQSAQSYVNLEDLRPAGILAGFRDTELRALEAVKFSRYAELAAGTEARMVLRFSGGQPALVEGTSGNGKYMVCAFDAGMDGSDLAVSPMFLPLLHRSVVYLAGETGRQKLSVHVGEPLEVQVPINTRDQHVRSVRDESADDPRWAQAGRLDVGGDRTGAPASAGAPAEAGARDRGAAGTAGAGAERSFTVTTPSGRKEVIPARYAGRTAVVTFDDTREPGHYFFEGEGRRVARAVNVDTRESDLRPIDLTTLAERLHIRVAGTIDGPDAVARSIREARHGKELYKLIVALVLALVTLELFLSRGTAEAERDA